MANVLHKRKYELDKDIAFDAPPGKSKFSERDLRVHASTDESESDEEEGTYEIAMGEDVYESDLHTGPVGVRCPKHEGHKDFIPIKDFTIDHLPTDWPERKAIFDYFKSYADLVVKISASKVSAERPRKFRLRKGGVSFAPRCGSGFVVSVYPYGERGQGHRVMADRIEEILDKYNLSELDVSRLSTPLVTNTGFEKAIVNIIEVWMVEHLFSSDRQFHDDNFSMDLIRQVQTCNDSKSREDAESVAGTFTRFNPTLNDWRKSRGMSVSEFCLALLHGMPVERMGPAKKGSLRELISLLEQPCPCIECYESEKPMKTWWMVRVRTAAHVVFDDRESDGARAWLFHEDIAAQPVTMRGVCGNGSSSEQHWKDSDINYFLCSLHDDNAGQKLTSRIDYLAGTRRIMEKRGPSSIAVIAHPHGSTKHITFGEYLSDPERLNEYSAPTCPGSSGGAVIGQIGTGALFDVPSISHSKAITAGRSQGAFQISTFRDRDGFFYD